MAEKNDAIWKNLERKLMKKKGLQSTSEVDASSMTPVFDEHDSSVAVAEPPKTRRIEGAGIGDTWMNGFQDRDTDAVPKETKAIPKTNGLSVYDISEKTRIKTRNRDIVKRILRKKQEAKKLIENADLSPPYHKNPEPNYSRDVKKHMATLILLTGAKANDVSLDDRINEYILETVEPDMMDPKEVKDKLEGFLHYAMIGYWAFCKERLKMIEGCEHVPDNVSIPLKKAERAAYALAFTAVAKSSVLRNRDAFKGKMRIEDLKKEWDDDNGILRTRAEKVLTELSNAFQKYFSSASMDAKREYHLIMHPNGDQDSGMGEILEVLELRTGLLDKASNIAKYT
jgi:hypothetical protein